MPKTEKQKEAQRLYREEVRRRKLADGKMKNVESRVVTKEFGLRLIITTFNKYDVDTIDLDGTINCEGGKYNGSVLRSVDYELKLLIRDWVLNRQDDFYKNYIAVIDVQDKYNQDRNWNYIKYVPKNKHIKFEITLKLKKQLPWKEVVNVVKGHISHYLYDGIVRTIESNGLALKDFKGHNLKSGIPVASEPQTS